MLRISEKTHLMNQQELVQDIAALNALTLLFIGFSLICGLLLIIGGIVTARRKKIRGSHARQILRHLLKWGILRDEDIERALAEADPAPEPKGRFFQMQENPLDRVLKASSVIQNLILNWERPSAGACIWSGIALLIVSLIEVVIVRVLPITTAMSLDEATQQALLVVALQALLSLLGIIAGMGIGLLIGVFRAREMPDPHAPPPAAQPKLSDYRSPLLALVPIALLLIDLALAGVALADTPWITHEIVILNFSLFPGLVLLIFLEAEYLMRRVVRLPSMHLSTDPVLGERANTQLHPRLIQILLGLECGAVAVLAFCQPLLLVPISKADSQASGGSSGFWLWLVAFLGMFLVIGANSLYGRLGGSVTGWPWSRRAE